MKLLFRDLTFVALGSVVLALIGAFVSVAEGREDITNRICCPWGFFSVGIMGVFGLLANALDKSSVVFTSSYFTFGPFSRSTHERVTKKDQPLKYWLNWSFGMFISLTFIAFSIWAYFYFRSYYSG